MRLFIFFIFLTFVVLEPVNAAPQSSPIQGSPIDDRSLVNSSGDDYIPTIEKLQYNFQIGIIGGAFGDKSEENLNYFVSVTRKKEISFERFFLWGFGLTSNQFLELKTQIDLGNLFLIDSPWHNFGFGLSQFMIGQAGFSNLVNINQTKFVIYSDLSHYLQLQAYLGFKGLAYSLSFQHWF